MDNIKLVTYMKMPNGDSSMPTRIMLSSIEKQWYKTNVNGKLRESRIPETTIIDLDPVDTLEGDQRPTLGRVPSSYQSPTQQHNWFVELYMRRGYEVTLIQDFEEWDRILDGIPGFEYLDPLWQLKKGLEDIQGLEEFVKIGEEP